MTQTPNESPKKGRPTPKRSEATAKRQSMAPIVGKEEKKRARAASKASRIAAREAFMRGDENALPARDRGPARRFVRDFIDSRRSLGEYFLPVLCLVLFLTAMSATSKTTNTGTKTIPVTEVISIVIMYSVFAISVIDGLILNRKIKKAVSAKFPDTSLKGLGLYGWLRSTQMRRMRTPKPQVKPGKK